MAPLTGGTASPRNHFRLFPVGATVPAVRPIVAEQAHAHTIVAVSDLHALTLEQDPTEARARTLEFVTLLLAAGADPGACLVFVTDADGEVAYDPGR